MVSGHRGARASPGVERARRRSLPGVLTSVASHHLTLNFEAVERGYTADQLRELGQSLVPVTTAIVEVTTAEWVKEARHAEREVTLGRGSIQSTEAESSVAPTRPVPIMEILRSTL
jgi:hypothetical protein